MFIAMKTERQIAESYRLRAEELRVVAGMDRNKKTRETLELIACDYERMAVGMDGIAMTREAMRGQ